MRGLLRKPFVVMPIAAVLAIASLWWFFGRSDDGNANAIALQQAVTVTRGTMSETVSADGTVAAAHTDDLSFTASGTVMQVNVKAGDAVKAGKVLATIDSTELDAAVASANSNLADAQAKLADDEDADASDEQISADQTSVTAAQDALANAKEDRAGASLVARFTGTVASVDLTVGEVLGSGGTGGTDVTGSDSGSGQSSSNLGSGNTGPAIGGADTSDSETSSTPQIQVVSTGRYTVEVNVDTSDIDAIKVGQEVGISMSSSASGNTFPFGGGGFPGGGAFPGGGNFGGNNGAGNQAQGANPAPATDSASATGTVKAVSKVADASSGVATYPVTITFDAESREFFVGSNVTAEITTTERENVLQVSSAAVTTSNGQSTVEVTADGTTTGPTETRTVETGMTSGGMVEITNGLEEGEKVVITLRVPGAGNQGGGNVANFGSGELPGAPGGAGNGG